jgi:uncharacterized protein (DUF3820 family)
MRERDELGLDEILDTIRKTDRAEADRAWERFGKDRPQILQEVLERLDTRLRLAWAAASEGLNGLDAIQERVGAAFEAGGPIPVGNYSGRLHVLSQNSALLTFSRAGKPTAELDGKTVEFYLTQDTANRFSVTIEDDEIVIDFERLGISIEGYTEVGFRIHLDESTTVEGTLRHESGESL